MTTATVVRRSAVVLAALASATVGSVTATPAEGAAGGAASTAAKAGRHTTTLTFEMPRCDGCEVQLYQGREGTDPRHPTAWISQEKKVADGEVRYRIQSRPTATSRSAIR